MSSTYNLKKFYDNAGFDALKRLYDQTTQKMNAKHGVFQRITQSQRDQPTIADKQLGLNKVTGAGKPTAFAAEFPSPRYFQVHFEYLDRLLLDATKALEGLRTEVAEVYRVMQTDPASEPCQTHGTDRNAKLALRIEPCGNPERSKRSAARKNLGCAVRR